MFVVKGRVTISTESAGLYIRLRSACFEIAVGVGRAEIQAANAIHALLLIAMSCAPSGAWWKEPDPGRGGRPLAMVYSELTLPVARMGQPKQARPGIAAKQENPRTELSIGCKYRARAEYGRPIKGSLRAG